MKNGTTRPATPTVAKVTNITSGRRRYAVTVAEGIDCSITFSLNREVWQDEEWPERGSEVVLSDVRPHPGGWRAHRARFYGLADENRETQTSNDSNPRKAEQSSYDGNSKGATKMESNEVRRQQLANKLKWAGWLGIVLMFGFLSPWILSGLGAMIALGVSGVLAFVSYKLWPAFTRIIVNAKYKMIADEARRNPVETNRRIYIQQDQVLAAKAESIKRFAGSVSNVGDTIESLQKRFGDDEQVTKLVEAKKKMEAKLERLKTKQTRARKAQALFAAEMEKAEAIWDATVEMIATQKLGGDAEDQALAEFESKTAFKSINKEFNAAITDLDDESDADGNFTIESHVVPHAALPAGSSEDVINTTSARERVPVARK